MELGLYSFGDVPCDTDGNWGTTAQANRNLLEAIKLADEVGLDYFGVGEHHIRRMPVSAAVVILGAAAASTKRIILSSSVTVLATDDPVRIYQQFATVDALSNGRAEIIAGRGSSTESFALFGHDLARYDELYARNLETLLTINRSDATEWENMAAGRARRGEIVPQPDRGSIPIWLGTGGNPQSSARAGQLGVPISYGVVGGNPKRFAGLAEIYRASAADSNMPVAEVRVAIGTHGFVGKSSGAAKDEWFPHWFELMAWASASRGFPAPARAQYDMETGLAGAHFVGEPEEVAERIINLHRHVGHMRHSMQMDLGHLPQKSYLKAIELLGDVKARIDNELGSHRRQSSIDWAANSPAAP